MKKNRRFIGLVAAIAMLSFPALFAQEGAAGMPGAYLHMGIGARGQALGNAYTAMAQDGSALFWNPAGLANQNPFQIYFMHSKLFMNTSLDYVAATAPTRSYGNFGLGLIALNSGEFDQRNELNEEIGNFNLSDMAFLASWSTVAFQDIAIGINYKLVTQKMLDYSGMGHGFDIGLRKQLSPWLTTGLMLVNALAPSMTLAEESQSFARQLRVGAVAKLFEDKMSVSTEISKILGWDKTALNIGVEYQVMPMIALRGGVNNSQITMGLGLSLNQFGMDYSNKNTSELGTNQVFALNYSFGGFGVAATAYPNVFSPAGEQNVSKIKLKVNCRSDINRWNFEIVDAEGNIVRNFAQATELPEEIVWDGRDDAGQLVHDGKFFYRFAVSTVAGETHHSDGTLVSINTAGPSGSLGFDERINTPGENKNEQQ